ncbi:MAG: hypothetical protein KME40_25710 [Komarekiella atlantica HA4396-MV6]|jgi:hypothetical protein|nr:hypothetical protein [Komarekiella atlantica HA4396-MV6]
MQLLLCIDVIANPKNSELFSLCKYRMNRTVKKDAMNRTVKKDAMNRVSTRGDRKNDRIPVLFTINDCNTSFGRDVALQRLYMVYLLHSFFWYKPSFVTMRRDKYYS